MDKIKRAIEESKRHRSITRQDQISNELVSDNTVSIGAEMVDEIDINVEYEQTRVISVNPEYLAKNRIVTFNKNNKLSLGFDFLRTQVIDKMTKNGWRTMAITSPTPTCGKTMVAINLAMSIAHHTSRTAILVDFDLRRPKIAQYLGLPSKPSLNDILVNKATISESLINPGLERLVILPTANPVKNSSEVLSSRKVTKLINGLRDRYSERIVMFDLPPILSSDDAMIMLRQVDCVLVVVGNGMVSKTDLIESMRYVDQTKLLGTVLNKSNSIQRQSGYN